MTTTPSKKRGRPKKIVKETSEPLFSITIKMGDKVFKGKGHTALEALKTLEKPIKTNNKAVVIFSRGTEERERVFMPVQLKRLFFSFSQPYLAKTLWMGI